MMLKPFWQSGDPSPRPDLLLIGNSVRAAAFSAIRAGFHPFCLDQFGDRDLMQFTSVQKYNEISEISDYLNPSLPLPWIYTGGIENQLTWLNHFLEQHQNYPLWGNRPSTLEKVRSPKWLSKRLSEWLSEFLTQDRIRYPETHFSIPENYLKKKYLLKPFKSGGGNNIRFFQPEDIAHVSRATFFEDYYLQEYLKGELYSAQFISDARGAKLLGITQQLQGLQELRAKEFQWCGNIGPITVSLSLTQALSKLANRLVQLAQLRGIFGIDFIMHEQNAYLLEVNPRYTGALELIEFAEKINTFSLLQQIFQPNNSSTYSLDINDPKADHRIAKGILYARQDFRFPSYLEVPIQKQLSLQDVNLCPVLADIPAENDQIGTGYPIMTIFAHAHQKIEDLFWLEELTKIRHPQTKPIYDLICQAIENNEVVGNELAQLKRFARAWELLLYEA